MAANSAAWYIAKAAGDTATCEALHEANVALANSAASGGGSASYNSASGTWNITTSSGSTISSSGSSNGKTSSISIPQPLPAEAFPVPLDSSIPTAPSARTRTQAEQTPAFRRLSITILKKCHAPVLTATKLLFQTAASEAAVAKALLGLTDFQAQQLQKDLEASKNTYVTQKRNTTTYQTGRAVVFHQ